MITKPFMIAPEVNSPDYTGFLRRNVNFGQDASHGFTKAMAEQQEEPRQSSVVWGTVNMPLSRSGKPAEVPSDAAQTSSQVVSQVASQSSPQAASRTVSEETDIRNRPVIALDPRSLQTLQRMGDSLRSNRPARASRPARAENSGQAERNVAATASREGQAEKEAGGVRDAAKAESAVSGNGGLGVLSAKYESGSLGIAAIGYDRNGGTSYGKYQISSRQGTFKAFLEFAATEAPDIAERLKAAGNANTGGRRGAVPEAWKAIAAEQPERFEALQEAFIRKSHYDPVEADVQKTLGVESLSRPMQEVLWSTAVQHGPGGARRLFEKAAQRLARSGKSTADEKALIETVYSLRGTQFGSSTPGVQAAVRQRFDVEKREAIAMLQQYQQQTMLA